MLQKPNIKQRKSDASFKEDSILSSDYRFLRYCKQLDLHQICSTGIRWKKVQTRSKSGTNICTLNYSLKVRRQHFTFFASNLLLVYLFFQFSSYLPAPRVNLRTWQVLCFVVYILGIELKISWLFYLFKNELQSYGFWKFQIVSWCTF